MKKINELDADGYFQSDHIEGPTPKNWTADLLGDGYYKAQYQNAQRNDETGEWSGGSWAETGGPSHEDSVYEAESKLAHLRFEADKIMSGWVLDLNLGLISDEDKQKLIAWRLYVKELDALKLDAAPDIEWPSRPQT